MAKFRKKPVEIDAVEFDPILSGQGYVNKDNPEWLQEAQRDYVFQIHDRHGKVTGIILTLEGPMNYKPGDWIIRGIKGEIYSCKRDVFEMTYEPM